MHKNNFIASDGEASFYLQCNEMLLAMAFSLCKGRQDIDPKDLAQDVLVNLLKIRLFDKVKSSADQFNLVGYLHTAAKYRFFDLSKKSVMQELNPAIPSIAEPAKEPLKQLELLIDSFMKQHPEHRQKIEAFLKIYLEGKTHEEVADEYNMNKNLLYQWLWRAKSHLSHFLASKGLSPEFFRE